ncbi:MAG: DUF6600 domain-containing protein [Thermoanaerobaculia bacterium]
MKTPLKARPTVLVLGTLLALALSGSASPLSARTGWSVSFSSFQSRLSPYGTWVTVGNYGRCWRPSRVSAGWQPYSNGEWLYTDYGWSWVSYDPWGAYPYHYGSWVYEPGYGWVWVPGYVWGPAWVTWCYSDDFIGWAPLSPAFVFTTSGYFGRAFVDPPSRYVFVPTRSFVGVNAATVRLSSRQNATLLRRGTSMTRFSVANGVVRTNGPDPKRIERVTRRTIRPTSLAAAKLHPTRIDAVGRAHSSRIALTSRAAARPTATRTRSRTRSAAVPGRATTQHGTAARSHSPRYTAPHRATSSVTAHRVSPPAHNAPKRVVAHRQTAARSHSTRNTAPRRATSSVIVHRASPPAHNAPKRVVARSARPKTMSTIHRNAVPRAQVSPQRRVAMAPRHETPRVERHVSARASAPNRGARIVESRPAPAPHAAPMTRTVPIAHAAPRMQTRSTPRMESRPVSMPRAEARHAQPAPRGPKKESGR